MKTLKYKKLPGRHRGLFSFITLWLGDDHLLLCHSLRYIHSYKRFYFKDIQGITVRKTAKNMITQVTAILLTLVFTMRWLLVWPEQRVFFSIFIGFYLLVLLVCTLKGPTCETSIQTAVQTEKLPSLSTLKRVEKTLKRIKPLIAAAQGELASERIEEEYDVRREKKKDRAFKRPVDAEEEKIQRSSLHKALFFVLIGDGSLTYLDYYVTNVFVTALSGLFFLPICILTVMAVVRQSQINVEPVLKKLTWCSLVYMVLAMVFAYCFWIYIYFQTASAGEPIDTYNQWESIKFLAEISPQDNPALKIYFILSMATSFILGGEGTYFTVFHKEGD